MNKKNSIFIALNRKLETLIGSFYDGYLKKNNDLLAFQTSCTMDLRFHPYHETIQQVFSCITLLHRQQENRDLILQTHPLLNPSPSHDHLILLLPVKLSLSFLQLILLKIHVQQ